MGLLTSFAGLFKKTTEESAVIDSVRDASESESLGTVEKLFADDPPASEIDSEESEPCPCGGSCTCQEPEIPSQLPLPGLEKDSSSETVPTVRKIEDAKSVSSKVAEKALQATLPGFEEPVMPTKTRKKKSNSKKANAKLARKSTTKRKK